MPKENDAYGGNDTDDAWNDDEFSSAGSDSGSLVDDEPLDPTQVARALASLSNPENPFAIAPRSDRDEDDSDLFCRAEVGPGIATDPESQRLGFMALPDHMEKHLFIALWAAHHYAPSASMGSKYYCAVGMLLFCGLIDVTKTLMSLPMETTEGIVQRWKETHQITETDAMILQHWPHVEARREHRPRPSYFDEYVNAVGETQKGLAKTLVAATSAFLNDRAAQITERGGVHRVEWDPWRLAIEHCCTLV